MAPTAYQQAAILRCLEDNQHRPLPPSSASSRLSSAACMVCLKKISTKASTAADRRRLSSQRSLRLAASFVYELLDIMLVNARTHSENEGDGGGHHLVRRRRFLYLSGPIYLRNHDPRSAWGTERMMKKTPPLQQPQAATWRIPRAQTSQDRRPNQTCSQGPLRHQGTHKSASILLREPRRFSSALTVKSTRRNPPGRCRAGSRNASLVGDMFLAPGQIFKLSAPCVELTTSLD